MNKIEKLIEKLCPEGVEFYDLVMLADIGTGSSNGNEAIKNGKYPLFVRSKHVKLIDTFEFDEEAIVIPGEGGVGEIFHYINGKYALHQRAYRIHFNTTKILTKFAYYYLFANFLPYILKKSVNATVRSIRKPMIEKFRIPIPPLPIQEEILKILDNFTELDEELKAELEARKKQYEHYREEILTFGDDVEWITLKDVCLKIFAGGDKPKKYKKGQMFSSKEYPYPIFSNGTDEKALYGYTNNYKIDKEAITISARGTIGYHTIRPPKFTPIVRLIILIPNNELITTKFLNYVLDITEIGHSGGSIPQLTTPNVKKIKIPLPLKNGKPDLGKQKEIVKILDKFNDLVNNISVGLPAELKARKKQYEYYREKLLTFKEKIMSE